MTDRRRPAPEELARQCRAENAWAESPEGRAELAFWDELAAETWAEAWASIGPSDDELFLMVNVRGRSSGLPMNISIGSRGHAQHAACVRVQMDHHVEFDFGKLAVVSVEDDPPQVMEGALAAADLELVRRYIALNRPAILDHWREKTDGTELSRALERLEG